jgi:L-lactate utilization protein LutC
MMEPRIENILENWQRRNIQGIYCANKEEAAGKILEIIPQASSIGLSGSVTLDQLGVAKLLAERGNNVFNQYTPGITREENLALRRLGTQADYYLASANAIAATGELVFFSAYGNRTSGISNAKNVIIVAGVNKIVNNLDEALKRGREYATPLNCKRLKWQAPCFKDGICRNDICFFPEYKRMCCQVLVVEAEVTADRLKVILVAENLGF